jgi:hypothetical protein
MSTTTKTTKVTKSDTPAKNARYGKANLLSWMKALKGRHLDVQGAMAPIDNSEGSRFGEDVIRITGSDMFCAAVLSRLQDLVEVEGPNTRLDCSWSEVKSGDGRFAKGDGGNSIYLRMAVRRKNWF